MSPLVLITLGFALLASGTIFYSGLRQMVFFWGREEYSHGYLIPFVAAFLLWQKKSELERIPFVGSWAGFLIVFFGLVLYFIGELSTLYTIIQYAFLVVLAGLALSLTGRTGFKEVLAPLLFLIFMIPLPNFLLFNLSAQLQLVSSQIGVWIIRLFGIAVFLEGNVIDLGTLKLQVVEACSGLRYLFPLMTLAFIAAYFYKGKFWKRAIIFLSSIPITILMNSFRIGIIGVMSEYWGRSMAEGFLHDFEGWAVFMGCTAILVAEMWLLTKVGHEHRPLRLVFGLEFPAPTHKDVQIRTRTLSAPYLGTIILLVVAAIASLIVPQRAEIVPTRHDFAEFPMKVGEWSGMRDQLEKIYIDALKFDDYILTNFVDRGQHLVNLYVAYYASQRKGESAHSPRTCIPGGGWEITSFTQRSIKGATVGGVPLMVNRAVIQRGEDRQLVYYWFQQRGRVITSEYLVKWYLFWDALKKNRTDGALVRLVTPVEPGHNISEADERLASFAKLVAPQLATYIPE
jgi:exosortase D (VPLPA-CTERM-specific)